MTRRKYRLVASVGSAAAAVVFVAWSVAGIPTLGCSAGSGGDCSAACQMAWKCGYFGSGSSSSSSSGGSGDGVDACVQSCEAQLAGQVPGSSGSSSGMDGSDIERARAQVACAASAPTCMELDRCLEGSNSSSH